MGCFLASMNATEISPVSNSRISKITIVSRILKIVFLVLTLACVLASLMSLISLGIVMWGAFRWTRFAVSWYALLAAGADLVSATFTWFCYKLFSLYSRGNYFTAEVVHSLRRIGITFFFVTLAGVLTKALLPHGPPSLAVQTANSIFSVVNGLFFGFLILFIAWVMDEGRRIQEEQALTV